jgi:hypothetical protein
MARLRGCWPGVCAFSVEPSSCSRGSCWRCRCPPSAGSSRLACLRLRAARSWRARLPRRWLGERPAWPHGALPARRGLHAACASSAARALPGSIPRARRRVTGGGCIWKTPRSSVDEPQLRAGSIDKGGKRAAPTSVAMALRAPTVCHLEGFEDSAHGFRRGRARATATSAEGRRSHGATKRWLSRGARGPLAVGGVVGSAIASARLLHRLGYCIGSAIASARLLHRLGYCNSVPTTARPSHALVSYA